jgi:DNA segregation ATPase FtsK/SpoIIIE-like protein
VSNVGKMTKNKVMAVAAGVFAFAGVLSLAGLFGPLGEAVAHVLSASLGIVSWVGILMLGLGAASLWRGKGYTAFRGFTDVGLVFVFTMLVRVGGGDGGFLGAGLGDLSESALGTAGAFMMGLLLIILVLASRVDVRSIAARRVRSAAMPLRPVRAEMPRTEPMSPAQGAWAAGEPESLSPVAVASDTYATSVASAEACSQEDEDEGAPSSEWAPESSFSATLPCVSAPDGLGFKSRVVRAFEKPSASLLSRTEVCASAAGEAQLAEESRHLALTLSSFDVEASVLAVVPGPVVTTFECGIEAGTKLSKVMGLEGDLSLAFGRKVRVVPSRLGRVGFEVQSEERAAVGLRELLEDARWEEAKKSASLPVVIGRDVRGEGVYADLATMPHLIVGGATGSGKSVGTNVLLSSLLFARSPEEVRLVLIDPKVVELQPYSGVPHLLCPVVTDADRAIRALAWCCEEMDRRYQQLARAGAKNLASFNGKVSRTERMPFIVVVVDELADLMLQEKKAVEPLLVRLGQKARAAGIHVVVATQRPSVDVVTGLIKSNFPSRVAFRTAQAVDSKVVLDEQGAEHLLGKGDALVKTGDSDALVRVQVPMVTEDEVGAVARHLRSQGLPNYDVSILAESESALEASKGKKRSGSKRAQGKVWS